MPRLSQAAARPAASIKRWTARGAKATRGSCRWAPKQIAGRFKAACLVAGIKGATSRGAPVGMAQDLAGATALPQSMQAGGCEARAAAAELVG